MIVSEASSGLMPRSFASGVRPSRPARGRKLTSRRGLSLLPRGRPASGLCEHLQRLLPSQFLAGNRDRVLAGQATEAHVVPRMLQRRDEAAEGEVAEAVRIDEVRDLGDRLLVRDELVPRLHVDPEVAGEANRRATDSDMDLPRAREAQELDGLPDRRPPGEPGSRYGRPP